jgi:hypothetical protein
MESAEAISQAVDGWMEEERNKRGVLLRVVRQSDPWALMDEEEIEDIKEFIRWYLNRDFAALLQIPLPPREDDFWFPSYEEFQESAFNTHDFQGNRQPFDKYGYRVKKVLERVKDLAILYSCISSEVDREEIRTRYENLVNREFRNRLLYIAEKYRRESDEDERFVQRGKIGKLNRRILECKVTWEKYSRWE